MQGSWNQIGISHCLPSESSLSRTWFRLPLAEKRAHREMQFWVSHWRNHQIPLQPRDCQGFLCPRCATWRLTSTFRTRLLWYGKHPRLAIETVGDGWRGVSELTEAVALNNGLKRVSQVDILGESFPSRLASKCKSPEERDCMFKGHQIGQYD